MTAHKLAVVLVFCTILLIASPAGQCFSPYNPEGSGVLCFMPGPYSQGHKTISRNELESLWFYDITLEAELDTIQVSELCIRVEAHNCAPKTREAMLFSRLNTEEIWVYVQHLKINQQPLSNASSFIVHKMVRFNASQYRTVPMGELSSQKNMFLAEFKNIAITIKPGEKVILSFFGKFSPSVPTGTKITGSNLVPLWVYSGKNMKFKGRDTASEYTVQ